MSGSSAFVAIFNRLHVGCHETGCMSGIMRPKEYYLDMNLMLQPSLVTCENLMVHASGRHAATGVGKHDQADIPGPDWQLVYRLASFTSCLGSQVFAGKPASHIACHVCMQCL